MSMLDADRRTQVPTCTSCMRGFTLIELMVAVAVLAILLAVAVPSFETIRNISRLAGGSNELVTGIQLARSDAIRRNGRSVFCRSDDGATCSAAAGQWQGWLVGFDGNGDGDFADANEGITRVGTITAPLLVTPSSNLTALGNRLTFRADGMVPGTAGNALLNARLSVCMVTTRPPQNARSVSIRSGGRVAVEAGTATGCPAPGN